MIITGNCIEVMPKIKAESFHTCVTSPPYWGLRDYGLAPSYWPETTYAPMPGQPPIVVPEWTGCLGLEPTPEMFVAHMVLVFREVWRVLRMDGTAWVNFGDSYAKAGISGLGDPTIGKRNLGGMRSIERQVPQGLKAKDMVGIPWRVAFALQADGWYLRMDNIWHKPNPMPESVRDRPTKAHEYIFLLSKSERYYFDAESILEPVSPNTHARLSQDVMNQIGSARANGGAKKDNMKAVGRKPKVSKPGSGIKYNESYEAALALPVTQRNKRSVWTVTTQGFSEAHFATFPEALIRPCILAGAPVGGGVLDPFGGSGTTLKVSLENNRECTIIEMGPHNVEIAERRTAVVQPSLAF